MICRDCGSEMKQETAKASKPYHYEWSGMSHVYLIGIQVYSCPACGEQYGAIPRIDALHALISEILLEKPTALTGEELRFIRKNVDIAAQDFARLLGITPVHLSRLEHEKSKVTPTLDKLARALVAVSSGGELKEILLGATRKRKKPAKTSILTLKRNHWEGAA